MKKAATICRAGTWLGQPLPSFCLKIPTGGGKTLLATKTVDLANTHFRKSNRGLVLWIVAHVASANNQTLSALKDRDHPYRQTLDVASGARTLILEHERNNSHRLMSSRAFAC